MENLKPVWTPPAFLTEKRQPTLWEFIRAAWSLSRHEGRPFWWALLSVFFMAWTTPSNLSAGNMLTASWINTYVVANLLYLYSGLPSCRVYNNANISIGTASGGTALTFNTERWDTDTMHDTASATSEMVATTAGKYAIFGSIEWAANNNGRRRIALRVDGSDIIAEEKIASAAGGSVTRQSIYSEWDLAAGHYVELVVEQDSGSSLNIVAASSYSPEFGMHRIG